MINEKTCLQCGISFYRPKGMSQRQWTTRRFCSSSCSGTYRTHRVAKICQRCGVSFSVIASRTDARFCSQTCISEQVVQSCVYCGTAYHIKRSHAHKRQTCSRRCAALLRGKEKRSPRQGKSQSASTRAKVAAGLRRYFNNDPTKHPRYRGGHSHYRGPSWYEQREKARARDGTACRVCGVTQEQLGKRLSVHHITPFRYFADSRVANHIDNLISLCQSCHMKAEHGSIHLKNYT